MRVSSTQYHITVNAALQNGNNQLEKLMSQMASGNRLLRPSDDPISHVRASRLQREEANNAQYLSNIGALKSRMTHSETVLGSAGSDLQSARDLLLWALDGSNASADLSAMATSMQALRDSLYATTLTRDQEGNYLFSGTDTKTPTVQQDNTQPIGSRYSAGGNSDQQMVAVGNGIEQPANVSLQEMADWLNKLDLGIQALGSGNNANDPGVRAALSTALGAVDDGMDKVSTKIARLGGGQNIIATLEHSLKNQSTGNQTAVLDYVQLDYGEAAIQVNTLLAALKATQAAYGKVSRLSLFDAL